MGLLIFVLTGVGILLIGDAVQRQGNEGWPTFEFLVGALMVAAAVACALRSIT